MSLWSKLTGQPALPAAQLQEFAEKMLADAQTLAQGDPQEAMARLKKDISRFHELVAVGGPLHGRLQTCVAAIRSSDGAPPLRLPSVQALPWSTWPAPSIRDILHRAQAEAAEVLYFTAPAKRGQRNALAELDALDWLGGGDKQVMAVIGEEDMLLRRAFLLQACPALEAASEEIGPDLDQYAKRHGFQTWFIVA